ncbi:metallophosphoesterase family protein [Balneicella halophila]|uniref:metallophosphoesterase family protein n=1 Tax=Balneicella halophila TaxID=1537566 RepID=UPI002936F172|nr:metallophosphoesterase [Balneicella halophila]
MHFAHNKEISPYVPIHTLLGNHEVSAMFGVAGLGGEKEIGYYRDFFILDEEEILYKPELYPEAKFRTENFYAKQIGNILYLGFDTEFNNTVDTQYEWMQRIMEAANNAPTVDWILSGGHRPYGAEQYPTDINLFIRDRAVPYLAQFDKYVMHIGAHHHLYSRGQLKDRPVYHIISGGTAWNQYWGDSKEEDMPDIQKTLTEWAYQIVDIDVNKGTFNVESYSIGTVNGYYEQDKLIDTFHRYKNKNKPEQPTLTLDNTKDLPIDASVNFIPGSNTNETLNSTEFVISKTEDFARIEKQIYRDFENWFGRVDRKDITVNQNENVDIKELKLRSEEKTDEYTLSNGTYYIKARTRDKNLEWSDWSEIKTFTITNSTPATPELSTDKIYYQLHDDQIITNFSNSSINPYAWVGIYTPSQKPGSAGSSNYSWAWDYTNGIENGSISFKNLGTASGNIKYAFTPGIYYAYLSKNGSYSYIAHSPSFYVGPIIKLITNKLEYNTGEEMILQYNNAPVLESDVKGYISVYKKGKVTPIKIENIGQQQNNTITINGLEKGYYYAETYIEVVTPSAWSIEKGITSKMQIGNIVNFKVGQGIITELFLDKGQGTKDNPSIYKLNETITPNWENAPGIIKDWIGIYKEGYTPDQSTNPNSGYCYTYFNGLSKGSIAIPSKNLPKEPGNYYMSIFTNDTYKEVSNRVHFTVVDCSPKANVSDTATEICAGEDATFEIIGTASSVVTYEINGDTSSTTLNSEGKATITINNATTSQVITLINIRIPLLECENALPEKTTITILPKITPVFEQIPAACKGTDFSLPTTSTNGITGTWSPLPDNTKTTEYTFTPDETCAKTVTMTVMANEKVTPAFEQIPAVCKGTDFSLPTTSKNGITGTWSPQFDNTKTTEYIFTPDETCAKTVTMR